MVDKSTSNSRGKNDDEENNSSTQPLVSAQNIETPFARQNSEDIEQQNNLATILIVDDTPNNLQILFSYLEAEGFRVLLTEDGESALQIAQNQIPDLILLDVLMPEIDGFQTCIRLKSLPSTKDIPIIFLTALSDTVNKVRAFQLGGVDYITKPLEQEEVLARIKTHLNLQQMRLTLAKQNRELQQRLDFEKLSHTIIDKIRDTLEESLLLKTATEELVRLLNLGSCAIELYNIDTKIATIAYESTITLSSCLGETRKIEKKEVDFSAPSLRQSSVKLVSKKSQLDLVATEVICLSCPLFDRKGIIGKILLFRPSTETFSQLEIQFVEQVASKCTIAIRQARLHHIANRQVEELAKLNKLKDDFLKTISHELKTPVANIKLATQTMEKLFASVENRQQKPLFQKVLSIFQQSCERQNQLIDDLLTLCYLNAKEQIVNYELINLHLWVRKITQAYWQLAEEHEQTLVINLPKKELYIYTDPLILERIFRELLQNAFKYTPKNQTIAIEVSADNSYLCLSISNTGVEISPEEQKSIFDRFYRIPNNDPWQYGGTGLGLNLATKLAETIEASLQVESTNKNTSFCLKFPKKPH